MKRSRILIILLIVSLLFTVLVGSDAAQNIDVKTMSDDELMVLLEAIMQKLEREMETEPEKKDSKTDKSPVSTAVPDEPAAQETDNEPKTFSVYENKMLVIGHMPDYWFIRRPVTDEDDEEEPDDNGFHYGGDIYPIYGRSYDPPDLWIVW